MVERSIEVLNENLNSDDIIKKLNSHQFIMLNQINQEIKLQCPFDTKLIKTCEDLQITEVNPLTQDQEISNF